ncbi:hypothetical protein GCM10009092_20670 [Bowmanella denitrificans]|uniref:Uncharacterized protein n=1 Tax=Bowmanella denitrificans TaxID=366582 RepID=A0ABN0X6G9_9ALTE|nr:hypothetical protein [Bowmanella denitrificans]
MDIESSLIAQQQGLVVNPAVKGPARDQPARQPQDNAPTEYPRSQVVARQGNEETQVQADKYRRQQQQFYDQPDSRGRQAVDAYQSLARLQLKDEIQQSMGIDTYV